MALPKAEQDSPLENSGNCNPCWQTPAWQRRVGRAMLKWFARHRRDLPWRNTHDPYRVWISEVMLQQTQVVTVIPYYQRFLNEFPTVFALAAADTDDVLRLWEGLGYYRRARQLHAAANIIVSLHNGIFPDSIAEVQRLPGIGRYTAGAILSIAGNQRQPILEANTVRLFSRLVGLRQPPARPESQRLLWSISEALLPEKNSGEFNQAAMELGSLVCTPRDPNCEKCPVNRFCVANELSLQQSIPGQVKKTNYESVSEFAAAIRDHRDRVWLRRRSNDERWSGLWDFPRYNPEDTAESIAKAIGFAVTLDELLATIRHGVTRFRITLHLTGGSPSKSSPRSKAEARWFTLAELSEIPLTAPARRLSALLGET